MRLLLLLSIVLMVTAPVSPAQTRPATPSVSAAFQGEVAQLAAGGLRLKEALEADLDGAGRRHLAAVLERVNGKNPSEAYEFRILESTGAEVKTIFTRKEFFFSFTQLRETAKLNGTDINGDGRNEILVQSSSGGNCWSCNPVEIYQIKDQKAVLLAAAPVQQIVNLDAGAAGDSGAELIVADARWEFYADLSHAASPAAKLVYAWRGGRYVNASRDFGAFYRAEAEKLRGALAEAKTLITDAEGSDDAYVGTAITLAISAAHAGEAERGLRELEAALMASARTAEQKKRRAEIIKDFRDGESAKKLVALKPGAPLL